MRGWGAAIVLIRITQSYRNDLVPACLAEHNATEDAAIIPTITIYTVLVRILWLCRLPVFNGAQQSLAG